MTVVSATTDHEARTLTVVAEFAAPPARVWQVWSDPRQLERWWGPPTWPATVVDHRFVVGGRSTYYMTGPDGEEAHGWWRFLTLDEPRLIEFEDGFADETGAPNDDMPRTLGRVELADRDGGAGTRMTLTSTFATSEEMRQLEDMGMVEGMTGALGQIDAMLAEG